VEFAAVLFAINVVTRLVVRFGFDGRDTAENAASLVMFSLITVALAAATFVRARSVPPATWLPEIATATIVAMLLTIGIGPFISGDTPFSGGAGNFFSQVWIYGGCAIVGTLLGYWTATALGIDHRSQTLKAYSQAKLSKPRRVVRR
jgi:hypothetical protein